MSPFPYTGGKCGTQFDPWKLLLTGLRVMVVVAPLVQMPHASHCSGYLYTLLHKSAESLCYL